MARSSKRRLTGSQKPSVRVAPRYSKSDGEYAAQLAELGGVKLDPWQRDILMDWMAMDKAGGWVSSACGGSVPRQNGKTTILQARAVGGMMLYNERIIYTAHEQKTSTQTFRELRDLFESPALRKYVAEIKGALGREEILLKKGGRISFVARTRKSGRGYHGDLLIFDEAQELDEDQQASLLPALAASKRPQTIYTGTPPDAQAAGVVFRRIRQRALDKLSRETAWFEFSVPEIGDVSDKKRWAATNPALGRRIQEKTIQTELEQMDEETFARERLGWWSPIIEHSEEYAIPADIWDACKSEAIKPEGKTAYGIKFSVDGLEVCLCGAVIPKEGPARITLLAREPTTKGTQWLADWLNARYKIASCVVIDGKNGVDVLVEKMAGTWKLKGSILRPNARDMIAAVSTLTDALNERRVTWFAAQSELRDSAITATKRPIAGGWGLGGTNSIPIEACALALWGARTSKRDPSRKMRIG